MTTSRNPRPNISRLLSLTQQAWISPENPLGLHPDLKVRGWEDMYAKPIWPDPSMASLDESIEKGYPFWHGWATGCWANGQQPMGVEAPYNRTKYGSTPRSFLDIAKLIAYYPGYVEATRKRTDRCDKLGNGPCGIYVGALPLNAFDHKSVTERTAILNTFVKFCKDCNYKVIGVDALALASQEWGKSSNKWFADHMVANGFEFCINAQPYLCPGMFEWLRGQFGCIAEAGDDWDEKGVNPGLYLRPENTRFAIKSWWLWLQGSVLPDKRMADALEFSKRTDLRGGAAIVDFDSGLPRAWWDS